MNHYLCGLVMRYFIELSYNGTNYRGWQIQRNARSVQAELNECISLILGEGIETTGSGRTDAGVHALQQFAHFDYAGSIDRDQLTYKLNRFLPPDISIIHIHKVRDDAHARFTAIQRGYQYIITSEKDPFRQNLVYYSNITLDVPFMNKAARILKRWRDFQSFSKVKTDVNHFNCNIVNAGWTVNGKTLVFEIMADRFLRGMVRSIVGTMLEIGQHRLDLDDLKRILKSRDRKKGGRSVPAHGLYLSMVRYPEEIFLD